MTKSYWWDAAELAFSFLRSFLIGSDTSPVEPVEMTWEIESLVVEVDVDMTETTEGFATCVQVCRFLFT